MEALAALIANWFGEGSSCVPAGGTSARRNSRPLPARPSPACERAVTPACSFALHGIGVSGGIAIGHAQLVSHATLEVAHYTIPASKVDAEIARFDPRSTRCRRSSRRCTAR